MKYALGVIALVCLAGCTSVAAPDRETDIKALTEAKVETWRQIYRDQDAAGLAEFLDDDFVFITGTGRIVNKNDEVTYLSENTIDMAADFKFHIEDIIFTSSDTAIVYGTGKSTRENDEGNPARIVTNLPIRSFGKMEIGIRSFHMYLAPNARQSSLSRYRTARFSSNYHKKNPANFGRA